MKPTLNQIFDEVLKAFHTTQEEYDAISNTRQREGVEIRQVFCYLGQVYGYPQRMIGEYVGLDHSTVHHNRMVAQDLIDTDREFASKVSEANSVLKSIADDIGDYTIEGWVARDKEGNFLNFFTDKKPVAIYDMWFIDEGYCYSLPEKAFPLLTFENSPKKCSLTLNLK